jgi:peptidoglycan/xylan/chitin deacetylase (PgdA/CDA1 family)
MLVATGTPATLVLVDTRSAANAQSYDRHWQSEPELEMKSASRPGALSLPHAAAITAAAVALTLTGCGNNKSLSVTVAGRHEHVHIGMTLEDVAARFQVQPSAGNLLDVQGNVLRRGVFPGSLLIDGRRASPATRLHNGDRVVGRRGRDRREPLRRELLPVRAGAPGNPQFLLARTPGVEVIVRGAISHELVSARFQPSPRRPIVERAVALTFDDGPSPTNTPRVLAVLRHLHVHATFFVVGYLVEQYPQIIALERRDGMTVGNHTYNHPEVPPFAQLPSQLIQDEIALGAQSLTRVGIQPRLLRTPAGSFSRTVIRVATALGERVVLWSVDPTDWRPGVTARQIAARVLGAVHPGSIVILHDGGGDRTATIRALPIIVRGIRQKGLRLVAITAG